MKHELCWVHYPSKYGILNFLQKSKKTHLCDILTWLEFTLLLWLGAQDGTVLLSAEAGSVVALSIHEL